MNADQLEDWVFGVDNEVPFARMFSRAMLLGLGVLSMVALSAGAAVWLFVHHPVPASVGCVALLASWIVWAVRS